MKTKNIFSLFLVVIITVSCNVKPTDFSRRAFVFSNDVSVYNSPYLPDSSMTTLLFLDSMKCIVVSQEYSAEFFSSGTYSVSGDKIQLMLDTFEISYSSGYDENGPNLSAPTFPTLTVEERSKRTVNVKIFMHKNEILLLQYYGLALFEKPEAYESTLSWLEGRGILPLLKNPRYGEHILNMEENP